ncbi:Antilisterial bacteriocin subtilosin biosynthesis protein AlbA [Thiorhodovibrio winogradskyi]|uniref:Antilisterial bacteriocin subtilosin biosynthesis protein AlbA n=1 Tax=Thiorhodovibrio winogradskyi TaxID=77007 RepID=A0ABZ0S7L9_9GAMM|nr:radical SAM protein [Thiorhodovibrio winogradskyi]
MYAIISPRFALRGWHGLPFGLEDRANGINSPLDAASFQALSLCDGKTPIAFPLVSSSLIERVHRLIDAGVAQACDPGAKLAGEQAYRQTQARFIDLVHWSITGKCNLRCRHCYMEAPRAKYGELSTEQCLHIVDQLHQANVSRVAITGGEPLIRADFWRIVDALREKGIILAELFTNGVLLTDSTLAALRKRALSPTLVLSFDGLGTHDWVRGVAAVEEKVIEAIPRAVKAGFRVSIETAVYKGNLNRLMPTYALLKGLGISAWKVAGMMNTGGWRREGRHLTAPRTALYAAYLDLAARHRRDGAPFTLALGGLYYGAKGGSLWMSPFNKLSGQPDAVSQAVCLSCRIRPAIMADGRLLPCIPMTDTGVEREMPRLSETTLSQALRDSAYFDRIDTRVEQLFSRNRQCRACAHRLKCGGGCRASALAAGHGDYFGADPDACFFFKNGYDEKLARKLNAKPASALEITQARTRADRTQAARMAVG